MSWISKIFFAGVDLDEESVRSDDDDAKLDQLNRQEIERGRYNAEIQRQIQANQNGPNSNYHANVEQQVNDEFAAGAREGFDKTVGTVLRAGGEGVAGLARGVP